MRSRGLSQAGAVWIRPTKLLQSLGSQKLPEQGYLVPRGQRRGMAAVAHDFEPGFRPSAGHFLGYLRRQHVRGLAAQQQGPGLDRVISVPDVEISLMIGELRDDLGIVMHSDTAIIGATVRSIGHAP